jgi:hypothetical protein
MSIDSFALPRPARNDRVLLPIEALESGNKIEVAVPAYKWEGMLAAERRDQKIVGGYRLAFPFQFEGDGCVGVGGRIVNIQNCHGRDPLAKPALKDGPVARLGDSKTVFAQDDHGDGNMVSAGNQFHGGSVAIGNGGESVGIQNQRHVPL